MYVLYDKLLQSNFFENRFSNAIVTFRLKKTLCIRRLSTQVCPNLQFTLC